MVHLCVVYLHTKYPRLYLLCIRHVFLLVLVVYLVSYIPVLVVYLLSYIPVTAAPFRLSVSLPVISNSQPRCGILFHIFTLGHAKYTLCSITTQHCNPKEKVQRKSVNNGLILSRIVVVNTVNTTSSDRLAVIESRRDLIDLIDCCCWYNRSIIGNKSLGGRQLYSSYAFACICNGILLR